MSDYPGLSIFGDDDKDAIPLDNSLSGVSLFADEAPKKQPLAQTAKGEQLQVEADAEGEMSELLTGFKGRADREDQRMTDIMDSEYWTAFCFQTREQKEEFLRKLDLIDLGDKYLDGMEVAKKLGVTLESRVPPVYKTRSFDREYITIAME